MHMWLARRGEGVRGEGMMRRGGGRGGGGGCLMVEFGSVVCERADCEVGRGGRTEDGGRRGNLVFVRIRWQ